MRDVYCHIVTLLTFLLDCPFWFTLQMFSPQELQGDPILLSIGTGFVQLSSLKYWVWWTEFFSSLKYQVPKLQFWNPFCWVRVVKNVISKWTKMKIPMIPSLWFSESTRRRFFYYAFHIQCQKYLFTDLNLSYQNSKTFFNPMTKIIQSKQI